MTIEPEVLAAIAAVLQAAPATEGSIQAAPPSAWRLADRLPAGDQARARSGSLWQLAGRAAR